MLTFYDPDGEADAFKDSEILRKHFKVKEKIQAKMIIIANALEGQRDQWSVADYEKSTFFKIGSSNLLRKTIKENAVILAGICKLKTNFFQDVKISQSIEKFQVNLQRNFSKLPIMISVLS